MPGTKTRDFKLKGAGRISPRKLCILVQAENSLFIEWTNINGLCRIEITN